MTNQRLIILFAVLGALLQGCDTPSPTPLREKPGSQADRRVDFSDPVLNRRQILLFGLIDQRAAELAIQKLLFLDGKSHDPIDVFLQTPGGELKHAMAVEETMRLLQSPVNTYALSECNSGGAMLLAAGTGKRRVFRGAVVILHGLKVSGKPPPDLTKRLQDSYTHFWRQRSRLPESWLPLPPGVLHVLSAEQALEYGLVDEVIER
jgi:ATP-dependent Clp protease, protease subunit